MNQEELAYLVGTARQTVSSWERDVFMPYSLTARVRDDSVMLSVERRECGKTVRYDMSPDDARKVFPHVELLWQRIKRESEGHT